MKTLFLTAAALACGNSVRTHCNYSSGPKLHQKSCDSPYKVELSTKNTEVNSNSFNKRVKDCQVTHHMQCPVGALRVYLQHTEN